MFLMLVEKNNGTKSKYNLKRCPNIWSPELPDYFSLLKIKLKDQYFGNRLTRFGNCEI